MFTVYKTVNISTLEYYIGVHKTQNLNDRYYGSGIRILRSIKKYGIDNFRKDILHIYDNAEQAFLIETEILDNCLDDKKCLNLARGGKGGANFAGRKHSKESINKIKLARSKQIMSDETKAKISEANRKRKISDETKAKISKKAKQRVISDKDREKISKSLKEYYKNHKITIYKRTDEFKKKQSKIMKKAYAGKKLIWIKNPNTLKSLRIDINLLQQYNDKGFIKGRILKAD